MGNPFRRIESPASAALQVIEAHRLFHLVTVIVHRKAMHCRSNCRTMLFYAYCAIISQLYVILCLLSYGAHFGLLCLLCHNKPTVCHTMPTMSYQSCSTYCGTLCLLILSLFSITSLLYVIICLLRCNAIPTIIYYAAVPTVGYCAIISQLCLLCHSKLQCLL